MIEILRLGENQTHDASFDVNRENGHPVYLLILVKTTAKFLIDDEWQITPPHIAVIFRPGQRHRYCANGTSYIDNWAHIQSTHPLLGEHFPFGYPILLHNPNDYYDLFHIICNEFYGVAPHRNLIIHNLTTALLDKIMDESNTREYPALYYQLTTLREQIYKHPEIDWNIRMMANKLNISTGYLHTLYQHFFNTTCIQDVIKSRVQTACELLISTSKSLDEIAELCGYHNIEHFIRQFKAQLGITPGKFRKNKDQTTQILGRQF